MRFMNQSIHNEPSMPAFHRFLDLGPSEIFDTDEDGGYGRVSCLRRPPQRTQSRSRSRTRGFCGFGRASEAIATRKKGRKGGGGESQSQSNPFFLLTRVPRVMPRCTVSSAFCPRSFSGLSRVALAAGRTDITGANRAHGRQQRRAGARGALLIKYLKQSMKANKKCHVGVGSEAERRKEGRKEGRRERRNWVVSLSVCLS